MITMGSPDFRTFAIKLAKNAGKILLKHYGKIQKLDYKTKTDFKTKVDDEVDAFIRESITKVFPDHNILSEENKDKIGESDYTWIVDPLDGTIPYTYGVTDHFAVSIALAKDNVPFLGVIYAPLRKELYVAEQGKGAFCNGKKLKIGNAQPLNQALIGADYCKVNRTAILPLMNKLLTKDGVTYIVTNACGSVALALVVLGKLHGYFALTLEPWDIAAGVVLLEEAGIKVTSITGKPWHIKESSLLAAHQTLHKELLKVITHL